MTDSRSVEGPPQDSPLIEPEPVANARVDPESVDTSEILRVTQSLNLTDPTALKPSGPSENPTQEAAGIVDQPPGRINILAVIALLLALTASPVTVIFGYLAVGQTRRAQQRGEGIAWVAVGLGWLWLIAWLVLGISAAVIWFDL